MARRADYGECCVGAAVLAVLSCARFGYEPLPFDPVPDDTNVPSGGALGGSGGANDGGTPSGGSAGAGAASAGASGSTDSLDAGDDGGSGAVGAGGCGPASPTATWAFASDTESWQLEADPTATGTLRWAAAIGDPLPGALEFDATINSQGNVRVYQALSPRDLRGKVIYARVLLDAGPGVSAKVFAQSGSSLTWADGGEAYLDAQQWSCVSLDLQNPAVTVPGFDRTDVRRIGVFIFGDASPRVYVDQVSY